MVQQLLACQIKQELMEHQIQVEVVEVAIQKLDLQILREADLVLLLYDMQIHIQYRLQPQDHQQP
jgi:hypothetical protein